MKKLLLLMALLSCTFIEMHAQMSDDQVVDYVKKANASGKDQQAIGKELLLKGVSREQLTRIRDKYQNQSGSKPTGSSSSSTTRDRKNNGETIDFEELIVQDSTSTPQIKIFGHDIFRSKDLSFEPNMNIATPANYILGPGDEVLIDIYGASQSSNKYIVSPDGTIVVDKIGPIAVSGLTVTQAQARVKSKVGVHYQSSSIKLSIGQTRTVLVNILGEVKAPGTYTISAFASVFNALYLAGGITELGTLRNIKVSRNGRIITSVDVYDFILNGKLTGNVMLQDNDVIIVGPYENLVSVNGRVKRPMYYEMKKNESLYSLIKYSGGFMGDAYKKKVRVERKNSEGYGVHTIDEWDFTSFNLEDGDSVLVDTVIKRYQNMIEVAGAVFHPGKYGLNKDCNTVKTLVEQAGGLTEDAFTNRAVLHRMKEDRTRSAMTIDISGIMKGTSPDVALANEDSLVITKDILISKRHYTVHGSVTNPNRYIYSEGITLEDAIVSAGGLSEYGSLANVEVSRMVLFSDDATDTQDNEKAKVYTFVLQDGLVIQGETGFKIKPNDIISVRTNPKYNRMESVYIGGEVMYPGNYTISNSDERFSDILKRAGGLKNSGSLNDTKITRLLTEEERERKLQLIEMSRSEGDSISNERLEIKDRYVVGVNVEKAMANPKCDEDIILRDGDVITIPRTNNTVKINGEVLYPNTVAYIKGKKIGYYMNMAGGISKKGNKSQAYIIYANGQVSRASKGEVKPGCEIVVPMKPAKKGNNTQTASLAISSAGVIATIGAVLINALK